MSTCIINHVGSCNWMMMEEWCLATDGFSGVPDLGRLLKTVGWVVRMRRGATCESGEGEWGEQKK